MKSDDQRRARVRELARLRSRAVRFSDDTTPLVELLREALDLSEALIEDLSDAREQQAAATAKTAIVDAEWNALFDWMPQPCVCTDAAGAIVKANPAAGTLLNTASARLETRLLMHYTDEREQFAAMLRRAVWERTRAQETMTIRPRERAALSVDVLAMTRGVDDNNTVLWFLSPVLPTPFPGTQPSRAARALRMLRDRTVE